jgi:hypothetical protein
MNSFRRQLDFRPGFPLVRCSPAEGAEVFYDLVNYTFKKLLRSSTNAETCSRSQPRR